MRTDIGKILRLLAAVSLALALCAWPAGAESSDVAKDSTETEVTADAGVATESSPKPEAPADAGSAGENTAPRTKEDGSRFRLAYVDYDEYMPASRQFYYILAGLEELGWIREGGLPFTLEDIDKDEMTTREMYDRLEEAELGPYLEFARDAFFYLDYEDEEESGPVWSHRSP